MESAKLCALRNALTAGSLAERRAAAKEIGTDPRSTILAGSAMLAGCADPDGQVRTSCIAALCRTKMSLPGIWARVVPALNDEDVEVRFAAASGLQLLGAPAEGFLAEAMSRAATLTLDPEPWIKMEAAALVGVLRMYATGTYLDAADDILVVLLTDPDPAVMLAASDALRRGTPTSTMLETKVLPLIGRAKGYRYRSIAALLSDHPIVARRGLELTNAPTEADPPLRLGVALLVQKTGFLPPWGLAQLAAMVESEDDVTRLEAAKALKAAKGGAVGVLPVLTRAYLKTRETSLLAAMLTIGKAQPDRAREITTALFELFAELSPVTVYEDGEKEDNFSDPNGLMRTIEWMARDTDYRPHCVNRLRNGLTDIRDGYRTRLAYLAGQLGKLGAPFIARLCDLVSTGLGGYQQAILSLGRIGLEPEKVIPVLTQALSGSEPIAAARALAMYGALSRSSLPALATAVERRAASHTASLEILDAAVSIVGDDVRLTVALLGRARRWLDTDRYTLVISATILAAQLGMRALTDRDGAALVSEFRDELGIRALLEKDSATLAAISAALRALDGVADDSTGSEPGLDSTDFDLGSGVSFGLSLGLVAV